MFEQAAWVGPSALDDWRSARAAAGQGTKLDVILMTHPRDEEDVPRLFPWSADLSHEERRAFVRQLRPVFGEVVETPDMQAGILFLPFFAYELLDRDRRRAARALLKEGLSIAAESGASIVCLGGLTGALSRYGQQLLEPARYLGVTVTTGHAATANSVAGTLARAKRESGRSFSGARLTVLGVGSIGGSAARLVAVEEDQPDELVLVDRPAAVERVEHIAAEARTSSSADVIVELTDEYGVLSSTSACYASDFVVSAVSLPNVVDVTRVAPGTILVDDSQPYCWSRSDAWQRFEERADLLPCEAGLVDCSSIGFQSHFPFDFADHGPSGSTVSWSCLSEGLMLALEPALGATTGEPTLDQVQSYAAAFRRHGLDVAPLQCGSHLLPVDEFIAADAQRTAAVGRVPAKT
jgi:predicted amino acid dehydrogenase